MPSSIPPILFALGLLNPLTLTELPLAPDATKHLDDREQMKMFLTLSQLAYYDPAEIKDYFGKIKNPSQVWTFDEQNFLSVNKEPNVDTQAFVVSSSSDIIVVFRGTEPVNKTDWLTDFDAQQTDVDNYIHGMVKEARVHRGFGAAFAAIWPSVKAAVERCDARAAGQPRKRLWITGHSLGGALTTLGAAAFSFEENRDIAGVYTFGQPAVGNEAFASQLNDRLTLGGSMKLQCRYLRVVDDQDVVPRLLPLADGTSAGSPSLSSDKYQHVGTLKRLDDKGNGYASMPKNDYSTDPMNIQTVDALWTEYTSLSKLVESYPDLLALQKKYSEAASALQKFTNSSPLLDLHSKLEDAIKSHLEVSPFESALRNIPKLQEDATSLFNNDRRFRDHSWSSDPNSILGPGYLQRISGGRDIEPIPDCASSNASKH